MKKAKRMKTWTKGLERQGERKKKKTKLRRIVAKDPKLRIVVVCRRMVLGSRVCLFGDFDLVYSCRPKMASLTRLVRLVNGWSRLFWVLQGGLDVGQEGLNRRVYPHVADRGAGCFWGCAFFFCRSGIWGFGRGDVIYFRSGDCCDFGFWEAGIALYPYGCHMNRV